MKRTVVLVMAVCLCALSLGATGREETTPAITAWASQTFMDQYNKFMADGSVTFAKANNCIVNFEMVGDADISPKLSTAIAGGSVPDTVLFTYAPILKYLGTWTTDIDDVFNEIGATMGGWSEDAKLMKQFGLIEFFDSPCSWYLRKDLLEKAGLPVPTTWDEFINACIKTQDPANGLWGLGIPISEATEDSNNPFWALMWAYGASFFDKDGNVVFNSPAMIQVYRKIQEWYKGPNKILPDGVTGWDGSSNNKIYLTGSAFAIMNTGSPLTEMRTKNTDLLHKTIMSPSFKGPAGNYSRSSPWGWVISKDSKFPKITKKYISYWYQESNYRQLIGFAGGIYVPALLEATKWEMFKDPWNQGLVNTALLERPSGYPYKFGRKIITVEADKVFTKVSEKILLDNWTVEQAVKWGDDRIRDLVKDIKD